MTGPRALASGPFPDLADAFARLPAPAGAGTLSSTVIPGTSAHRVARDDQGRAVLLLHSADTRDAPGAPLVLENVSVQHDVLCALEDEGGERHERLTVVTCTSTDALLVGYFLRIAVTLVSALGPAPTREQVARAVNSLVELFRSLTRPAPRTMQGLWAELLLIAEASNPHLLAAAWHATPEETFDFSHGSERLDVKSTTGSGRSHYFALDQLCPPIGTTATFASLRAERLGDGTSVMDLVERIRGRVGANADLTLRVEAGVASALGSGIRAARRERFDERRALISLAFYDGQLIPAVATPLPAGVTDVRFRSDLSGIAPMARDALATPLLVAAAPRRQPSH